ncbi:MAG TPA: hypothetical protein VFC19_06875 [Candidatus Limnocylindrales bacterium]|nr:hypothetical protein [Candidatus Limnocylindrales bacterium]
MLFWVGVALAPLAALMLAISSGTGGIKTALGVVIISVILIGLSITMRRDGDGLRGEIEETVFDEIDALRADVRADITQAAQATHRAFGEKLQYLLDQLESTRAELEATRVQVDAMRHGITQPAPVQRHSASAGVPSAMAQATGRAGIAPGVVRHTETVQVTTRHTVMDPHDDGQRGTTYSSHSRRGDEAWAPPPAEPRLRDDPWADPPRAREESWTEQRLREQFDRGQFGRGQFDGGVERGQSERGQSERGQSERGQSERGQSERGQFDRGQSERGQSERGQFEREQFEREQFERGQFEREQFERGREEADDRWRSRDSWQSKEDDDRWPEMRAGDRWASVRSDDRGRELRMGERRAAVHSDSSGTELRIEDRWAAVRREAGITGAAWRFDDEQRLDVPRGDFPYRDRPAITGSDREERWSDYQQPEYERERRYR